MNTYGVSRNYARVCGSVAESLPPTPGMKTVRQVESAHKKMKFTVFAPSPWTRRKKSK